MDTSEEQLKSPQTKTTLRWDLIGMAFTTLLALLLIFLLDTGSLAEWVGKNKQTKIDEVIVAAIVLLAAFGLFSTRKWLRLSRRLLRYAQFIFPRQIVCEWPNSVTFSA
jgi:hypothetical protein